MQPSLAIAPAGSDPSAPPLDAALEGLVEEEGVPGFRFHEVLDELEEGVFFLAFLTAQYPQ